MEIVAGEDFCSRSWILLSASPDESLSVYQRVDTLFAPPFYFYPETDWPVFGFLPPEGLKIFGAWRHPEAVAFVLLTENRGMKGAKGASQLVLSYTGKKTELDPFLPQLLRLKRDLFRKNGKIESERKRQQWLDRANAPRSLRGLTLIMGSLTVAINGFSLYLRKLPIPQIEGRFLLQLYKVLISLFHISALALFLVFTLLLVLYLCKYGYALLTREGAR